MEHPQKQFLAVVLTAKVLREAAAAVGPYTEELLQVGGDRCSGHTLLGGRDGYTLLGCRPCSRRTGCAH